MFPRLIPALDLDLHFVLCDFGALGTAYVETVPTEVDRDTIIRNMMSGEYDHPLHVIAVNPAKGWARDVSEDIARALVETAVRGGQSLPPGTQVFVESQLGGVLAEARKVGQNPRSSEDRRRSTRLQLFPATATMLLRLG